MPFVKIDVADPMQLSLSATPIDVPFTRPPIEGMPDQPSVYTRTLADAMQSGVYQARGTADITNSIDIRNHARQYRGNAAKVKP
jgi:hypothetical protein